MKVTGTAHWLVAKAATEGNFEVTLAWHPQHPAAENPLFSLTTTTTAHLGPPVAPDQPAPYRAIWAAADTRAEQAVLEGHTGRVYAVCAVPVDDRTLLASASRDGTVRLWTRPPVHPDRSWKATPAG